MERVSIEGGCQCGNVRYRISEPARSLVVCHCRDCQKQSASAFGMSMFVTDSAFELLEGTLKTFEVICDSGRTKACAFCPDCGVRIYHQTGPGKSIKAGTLDDTSHLEPTAHYWTQRMQQWLTVPAGVKSFRDDG